MVRKPLSKCHIYNCRQSGQTSVANRHEADFVVTLCLHLTSNKVPAANIGIITPYKEQKRLLEDGLRRRLVIVHALM